MHTEKLLNRVHYFINVFRQWFSESLQWIALRVNGCENKKNSVMRNRLTKKFCNVNL